MLTDDEKARLRAEEEFRAELRQQFAERKPSRWWALLNSAFGLWLLGSVSLAGLTFLYQKLESSYKAAAERVEIQRKVREELSERFDVAEYYLQLRGAHSCEPDSDRPIPDFANLILKTADGEDSGAYAEFRHVSATALFSQLFQLEDTSAYVNLPEREKKQFIAKKNWKYLRTKFRIRLTQPQSEGQLTCRELQERLHQIAKSFR